MGMDTMNIETVRPIMVRCAAFSFSIHAGDAPRKGTNLPCWIPSVSTRTLIPSADFGLEPGRCGEGNKCDRANGYLSACT